MLIDGLFFKLPTENQPDFVKGKISINLPKLRVWLKENHNEEWLNVDLKVSKDGKPYAVLNEWKPKDKDVQGESLPDDKSDDDMPF